MKVIRECVDIELKLIGDAKDRGTLGLPGNMYQCGS